MVSTPNINCIVWNAAHCCVLCPVPVYLDAMLRCTAIIQSQVRKSENASHFIFTIHRFYHYLLSEKAEFIREQYLHLNWFSKDGKKLSDGLHPFAQITDLDTHCEIEVARSGTFHFYFVYDDKWVFDVLIQSEAVLNFYSIFKGSQAPRCTLCASRTENSYRITENCPWSSTRLDSLSNCDGQKFRSAFDVGK